MIGFYGYTVWLTYASLISGTAGIFACLGGGGRPYLGMLFLLISGMCDAFDGRVARTKKNRTEREKRYGIQIDSLSDLVAFGILPAAIGASLIKSGRAPFVGGLPEFVPIVLYVLFALAALIRLAYFNVTEEEMQSESKKRTAYSGLPVTSAAVLFPLYLAIDRILGGTAADGYFALMIVVGAAFITRFKVKKPGLCGLIIMIVISAAAFFTVQILERG